MFFSSVTAAQDKKDLLILGVLCGAVCLLRGRFCRLQSLKTNSLAMLGIAE